MGQRIERYIRDENEVLLDTENKAQKQNERLFLYHEILMNTPNYLSLYQKENFISKKQFIFKDTNDFIIEELWP